MSDQLSGKMSKSDENNIRSAYRHFQRMNHALNRVKAPIGKLTEEYWGETELGSLFSDSNMSEDAFVDHIKTAMRGD
jgi:hypothetical protein